MRHFDEMALAQLYRPSPARQIIMFTEERPGQTPPALHVDVSPDRVQEGGASLRNPRLQQTGSLLKVRPHKRPVYGSRLYTEAYRYDNNVHPKQDRAQVGMQSVARTRLQNGLVCSRSQTAKPDKANRAHSFVARALRRGSGVFQTRRGSAPF